MYRQEAKFSLIARYLASQEKVVGRVSAYFLDPLRTACLRKSNAVDKDEKERKKDSYPYG